MFQSSVYACSSELRFCGLPGVVESREFSSRGANSAVDVIGKRKFDHHAVCGAVGVRGYGDPRVGRCVRGGAAHEVKAGACGHEGDYFPASSVEQNMPGGSGLGCFARTITRPSSRPID